MENNELKEKIRKNIKEEIAVSNIRKEFDMKKNQDKKIVYWISSAVAVFILTFGIFIGTKNINNDSNPSESLDIATKKDEFSQIELHINKMDYAMATDIDASLVRLDGEIEQIQGLDNKFKFINNIKVPNEYVLTDKYMIYTRKDTSAKDYDILHDYVFTYRKDEINTIIIAFSEIEKPLRDYFYLSKDVEISKIENTECKIYQYEDIYMATFKLNEIYFDIETNGITESELVELLQSIITKS